LTTVLAACRRDKTQPDAVAGTLRGTPPQWRLFRDGDSDGVDTRSGTPTLMLSIQSETEQPAANADPPVSEVGW
jgi:hypothetical protein